MPATNKKKVETAVLERERVRGAQTTLLRIYVCVCVRKEFSPVQRFPLFGVGSEMANGEKECRRVLCMCV